MFAFVYHWCELLLAISKEGEPDLNPEPQPSMTVISKPCQPSSQQHIGQAVMSFTHCCHFPIIWVSHLSNSAWTNVYFKNKCQCAYWYDHNGNDRAVFQSQVSCNILTVRSWNSFSLLREDPERCSSTAMWVLQECSGFKGSQKKIFRKIGVTKLASFSLWFLVMWTKLLWTLFVPSNKSQYANDIKQRLSF